MTHEIAGNIQPEGVVAANVEIEKKFLVTTPPDNLDQYPSTEISQGYALIAQDGSELRFRSKTKNGSSRYFMTLKAPISTSDGTKRIEEEAEISEDFYNQFNSFTQDRLITKTRYEIPHNGYVIELDAYRGKNEGRFTAEVEFDSDESVEEFVGPEWLGRDITSDKRYKNQNLAVDGFPDEA